MKFIKALFLLAFGAAALPPFFAGGPAAGSSGWKLEEVLSIGGPDEDTLIQWTGVATDAAGQIYVLDYLDHALKKFDERGAVLGRAGRRGQGPGEFMLPAILACAGDRLYIADAGVPGISVFGTDLKFIRRLPRAHLVDVLRPWGRGGLAIHETSLSRPGRITFIDAEGETLSEVLYQEKSAGWLYDQASLARVSDGEFVLAYLFDDRIEKWTVAGKRIWSAAPLGGGRSGTIRVEADKRSVDLPNRTCFLDAAVGPGNRLFVLGGRAAKNPGRDVLVFDAAGRPGPGFTLPQSSHCLYFDAQGFLYVRGDEGTSLKKYRLIET